MVCHYNHIIIIIISLVASSATNRNAPKHHSEPIRASNETEQISIELILTSLRTFHCTLRAIRSCFYISTLLQTEGHPSITNKYVTGIQTV